MMKCAKCGREFDVDETRVRYEEEFKGEGLVYDERYPDNDYCFVCAMNDTRNKQKNAESFRN